MFLCYQIVRLICKFTVDEQLSNTSPKCAAISFVTGFYRNGVGWVQFFLVESQSRLYPHMRAKFGRDPKAVSKKVPFNFISTCMDINVWALCNIKTCL